MKTLVTILLSACATCSFGQTIEKFYTFNWQECEANEGRFYVTILKTDSGYVRKDYFIHEKSLQMSGKYIDKDSKVKNGYFYYFHPNGVIDGFGKYVNGKKEGLWLHYHPNGTLLDSGIYSNGHILGTSLSWHLNGYPQDSTVIDKAGKGLQVTWFDDGSVASAGFITDNAKPSGTWQYFYRNGQVSCKETYQNDAVINKLYCKENGEAITDTTNADREATFPGGIKAWQKYLMKQAYFPDRFQILNADKAVVVITFTVNEDGKVEDIEVSTPFYPEFDKIAKDAIRRSPDWLPSINHNRKVKFTMRQPITFAQREILKTKIADHKGLCS